MARTQPSIDWLNTKKMIARRSMGGQKKHSKLSRFWRLIRLSGPVMIIWGVLGVYVPVIYQEIRYQTRMTSINFQSAFPQGLLSPLLSWETVPGWAGEYGLEIPKLGIQYPVIKNVDAGLKSNYSDALTKGVAHAVGSASPGKPGAQYYFAHSSGIPFLGLRATIFSTLNKLDTGDEVVVYKDGQKYDYVVMDKQIVNPDDVRLLNELGGSERVVLQTCWPLGTSWKRLLVIAKRA